MRLALKVLGGIAALLLVLLVGIVVAVYTVDVNTLIAPVKDRVKAATSRDLTVRGGGSLSFSLQPKLVLTDVSLGNAPWSKTPEMIRAQRLELQVALLPLLSRRFELVELTLVRPVIALETDAKGQKSWEFAAASPPAAGSPPAPSAQGAAGVVAAGNVVVTDGTLTYRDGKSGDVTRVDIERFFVRARAADMPIATEFRGKVDDVAVSLEGSLGPIASLLEKRWPYPVSLKGEIQGRPTEVSTKIKAQDDVYTLGDLNLKFGANAVTGDFAIATGGARPKFKFALHAPTLVMAELPIAVRTPATAAAARPAPRSPGLFPDAPVDFGALRAFDADGNLAVGRLVLPAGRTIDNFRVTLVLAGGRLEVPTLQGALLGGSLAGSLTVDASRPAAASLVVRLNATGLSLGAMLAAMGQPREVRGGASDLALNVAMRGRSPREWASTVSGNVKLVVGPATLVNTKMNLDAALERLFDAVNPLRKSDPSTDLVCAVIRLPFENGVARVNKSVAMETKQLGVSASGTLDLRNETMDFSFAPRVHKGLPIQIPNLAQLVRFAGPIAAPEVKVDAVGSAAAIASIGAAVGTGGLSAIGQALFSSMEAGGDGPCRVALGVTPTAGATPTKDAPAKAGTSAPIVDDVGRAIGRLFGK